MKKTDFKKLLDSISIDSQNIKIDELVFPIKGLVGQGYHKQVFEIDKNKVLKIIRKDSLNLNSSFVSFRQAIEGQKILEKFGVNYAKIIDFDKKSVPYRFLIQEKIPNYGISVAELIKEKKLKENDVYQMATIVNKFEISKKWQIDTSPFNWFRVKNKMIYTDGSVYKYDENWSFKKIGLLQWLNLKFISNTNKQSTKIPSKADSEKLAKRWNNLNTKEVKWWKKYLNSNLQP
jgi:hypothetical protein